MTYLADALLTLMLWATAFASYMLFNHGIAPNTRGQQLRRYVAAAIVATLPLWLTATQPCQPTMALLLAVALLWQTTYPLAYHLTHRHTSPDYDNRIDEAFGSYLFAMLTATAILLPPAYQWAVGIMAAAAALVPIAVWVYYAACHVVIDAPGMTMLQETHVNEVIEYLRSYPLWRVIAVALAIVSATALCVWLPTRWPLTTGHDEPWRLAAVTAVLLFTATYCFRPRRGLIVRCGVPLLYLVVQDYVRRNAAYMANASKRLDALRHVTTQATMLDTPHTLMLVIGESASRDHISAFTTMEHDTTPWLRALAADTDATILFPHAYSCNIQTVPSLELALTEANQYAGGEFATSPSIVDMAHAIGYHVHWYSNQGHLGAADTPVTLVANTSDAARWTHQVAGRVQYDHTLIDMLREVDPAHNNLVVLHLKGSHFNYENRFPPADRQWGTAADRDRITNYHNSLHYTDSVLHAAYDYARRHLNLQAMVYCSDHAESPGGRRMPNFGGFLRTRIPLFVWLADTYRAARPDVASALHANAGRYWTNDLLYDLVLGIMDVRSSHFDPSASLASPSYRFTRDELTCMHGTKHIKDDPYDTPAS